MTSLEALQELMNGKNKIYNYYVIKKELKALEIIKAIKPFIVFEDFAGKYHLETIMNDTGLTKENYEILKEVML